MQKRRLFLALMALVNVGGVVAADRGATAVDIDAAESVSAEQAVEPLKKLLVNKMQAIVNRLQSGTISYGEAMFTLREMIKQGQALGEVTSKLDQLMKQAGLLL
ncbi:MAG TPA: hypothetical protein VJJ83_00275 [Candidatus Babeliales bacterium]|nr:hypothetical protein [Candidatus Babeliales bacterium]